MWGLMRALIPACRQLFSHCVLTLCRNRERKQALWCPYVRTQSNWIRAPLLWLPLTLTTSRKVLVQIQPHWGLRRSHIYGGTHFSPEHGCKRIFLHFSNTMHCGNTLVYCWDVWATAHSLSEKSVVLNHWDLKLSLLSFFKLSSIN